MVDANLGDDIDWLICANGWLGRRWLNAHAKLPER
jgi:hypothetical protein